MEKNNPKIVSSFLNFVISLDDIKDKQELERIFDEVNCNLKHFNNGTNNYKLIVILRSIISARYVELLKEEKENSDN